MINNRKDLEQKVLEYNPELKARIEQGDERAKSALERIADKQYANYAPFVNGAPQKIGKVGRVLGYTGDLVFLASAAAAAINPIFAPYMLTGLLLKKGHLALQTPEIVKTIKYGIKTGDYWGTIRNTAAKAVSYLPTATIVDRGLSKISQGRMIRRTSYEVNEELGLEKKPWYQRNAEHAENAGYTDVRNRSMNIVGPWKKAGELKAVA